MFRKGCCCILFGSVQICYCCGFDFKFVKNDSVRVTTVCTLREQRGCTWLIHGRVQTCNGYFYLKRLNSELVYNVFGDRIRDKSLTRPIDVVFDVKKEYGLTVSYHIVWLGVEKVRGEVYSDYHVSFDQLRWYLDAVVQYNPGSYVNLDFEQSTGRFKWFFISFKSCIDGFNHIHPLLGRFKGNLLAATGKDGNKGLFRLAFAIVDSETTANWTWFLEHLTNVVNSARTLTFLEHLTNLPTVFPSAHHAYCLQHLQANLRDKLRWVDNRGKWYGEMTSNAAESFNKWILDAYNYPITRLVDAIRNQIMTMRVDCKLLATNWNGLLCPKMESRVRVAYSHG
ncbi:hypothetical protein ACSBR1_003191 [Camellia fascicularis]